PFALLGRAAALIVLPLKLSPEYGLAVIGPHQRFSDPYLDLGLVTLLAGLVAAVRAWRSSARTVLFLLLCTALTYAMVANVKLIGVVFAERLLYLPSVFVLILAAMALARLKGRTRTIVVALVLL